MPPIRHKLKPCNRLAFNQIIAKLKLAKWDHTNWFIHMNNQSPAIMNYRALILPYATITDKVLVLVLDLSAR